MDEAGPPGLAWQGRAPCSASPVLLQPLRVNPVRPVTAATLLVAFGVLAALPFRRDGRTEPAAEHSELLTGPRRDAVATLRTAPPTAAGEGLKFDPSLAWQPVPISLPEWAEPELPPMPNSYYDTAFELEQPDPIRKRFSAAVSDREPSPLVGSAPQTGKLASSRAKSPEKLSEKLPELPRGYSLETSPEQPQSAPPATAASAPWSEPPRTAHDLIQDRFVYSPIAPPATPPPSESSAAAQRQTPAQRASMVRSGLAADDPQRPRHFIREPQ